LYETSTTKDVKGYESDTYYVPAGSLGFSVALFSSVAIVCIIILLIRRAKVGGELGGTQFGRTVSALLLVGLWCIYILFSIL